MSSTVLDASAILALLHKETGYELVEDHVACGAAISTVNLAEVATKLSDSGMPTEEIREVIQSLSLDVVDFDLEQAYQCALLRPLTKSAGRSFGDRACLALGQQRGQPVLTADRAWTTLALSLTITVIR